MNEQEVLNRFTYDDEAEIMSRISSVDRKDYRANKDIINEIVLWKMNRRPQVQEKLIDALFELDTVKTPMEAANSKKTSEILAMLLCSKGMRLPMASTVLHFYYPDVFPIIDQRAYRELYGKEFPGNLTKVEALTKLYVKYVEDCYIYQQRNCPEIPYAKIDKVLYQLDKEKVKY